MRTILRNFWGSFGVSAVLLLVAVWYRGWFGLGIVVGLAVLEIVVSFDNAVANVRILGKLSPRWQKIFLTVGVAIAVFGMRLMFPIGIVSLSAWIWPHEAMWMAFAEPSRYELLVTEAHPMIAAF